MRPPGARRSPLAPPGAANSRSAPRRGGQRSPGDPPLLAPNPGDGRGLIPCSQPPPNPLAAAAAAQGRAAPAQEGGPRWLRAVPDGGRGLPAWPARPAAPRTHSAQLPGPVLHPCPAAAAAGNGQSAGRGGHGACAERCERGGGTPGGPYHDGGTGRGTRAPPSQTAGTRTGGSHRQRGSWEGHSYKGMSPGRSRRGASEVSQLRVTPREHAWGRHISGRVSPGGVHARRSQLRVTPRGSHTWGHRIGEEWHLGKPQEEVTSGNNIGKDHTWGGLTCGTPHHGARKGVEGCTAGQAQEQGHPWVSWGGGSGAGGPGHSKVWGQQPDGLALPSSLGTSRACWGIHPGDPKTRRAGRRKCQQGSDRCCEFGETGSVGGTPLSLPAGTDKRERDPP